MLEPATGPLRLDSLVVQVRPAFSACLRKSSHVEVGQGIGVAGGRPDLSRPACISAAARQTARIISPRSRSEREAQVLDLWAFPALARHVQYQESDDFLMDSASDCVLHRRKQLYLLQRRSPAGVFLFHPAAAGGGEHFVGAEIAAGIEGVAQVFHRGQVAWA